MPENIIEVCVAIDIAILGIAYPIIVDKISNIGEKYTSEYVPVLFGYEFPHKSIKIKTSNKEFSISIFKLTLYLTLFSLFFLIFQFPPLFGWDNWIINNSANLLVFSFSTLLVVLFFIWLDKVVLYNGKSTSLLKRLIKGYTVTKENTEKRKYHLKAINELTLYAIEKQDEHLQETLLEFYHQVFSKIRQNHDIKQPLIYPADLYFLVNKLCYAAINIDNKKLKAIEHRAVSGLWLLGEDSNQITISEETYNYLWINITTVCDNPNLINLFWSNSNQYFDFKLRLPEYEMDGIRIINQVEIEKRENERNKFLEFHYALGGLVLYRKQYNLLKYLIEYSRSQPPSYPLLPANMSEIFKWFEHFRNDYKVGKAPIDLMFSFPELDNLGNSHQIKYWICSYISVLFIRQYTLTKYYIFQDFTSLPNLPNEIQELNNWLGSIPYFEKCYNEIISNNELLECLGFSQLVSTNHEDFKTFFSQLKKSIESKIGEQKLNAPLSNQKISNFYSKSNEIILKVFENFKSVFVPKNDEYADSKLIFSINGERTLVSKSTFTENEVYTMDYDSFYADHIASNKIMYLIPLSFSLSKTKRYLVPKSELISSLNKIIGKNDNIALIAIRVGFQVKTILDNSMFSNTITYLPSNQFQSQDTLYIIRKSDLPALEHKDINEDEQKQLKLISINDDLKLYASIIDINKEENKEIKDNWRQQIDFDDSDLKVQIAISFLCNIIWKNNRNVVELNVLSDYKEQGIQNSINDIEPI